MPLDKSDYLLNSACDGFRNLQLALLASLSGSELLGVLALYHELENRVEKVVSVCVCGEGAVSCLGC